MSTPRTSAPARPPAAALLAGGLVAVLLGALVGGAATATIVADPGPLVRWGILVARVVQDLASAATVGLLVLAAFLTPETTRTHRRLTATRLAATTGVLWVVSSLVGLVLTFASLAGEKLSTPGFLQQLSSFVLSLETTRVLLISAGVAALVTVGAALATSRTAMAWLALLAVGAVLPLSLNGHAAGATDHETAVNALAAHLVGVVLWVGGLLALAVMRPLLGADLPVTASRFSVLAGWCFGVVAASGLLSAWIRLGGLGGLTTAYGLLIVLKVAALAALGYAGWRHRRTLLARLHVDHRDGAAFLRLVVAELAVMGAAVGLGVALSRSAPPVPETPVPNPSPAFVLTGYPDPGPFTPVRWLTTWQTDWLWLSVAVVMVGLYLTGVRRLRRRGDHWPVGRPVLWVLGWAFLVYSLSGAPGVYGRVLFSMHMVMHMTVAMLVPLLLVPAAPLTLALRVLPARPDKTWGPREVVLEVVHSRYLRLFANPVIASALFFFSLAVFYYSPLFDLALRTHTGHQLMVLHFLLTGYLFTWVLIGIDPGPRRWSPLILLVILFATMSFHAFFGVVMTDGTTLLAPHFFEALHLPWMTDPLGDQQKAGAIAWGVGEAPTLVLTLLVAVAWVRSDRAETKRRDRQADRDGDAERLAYNAHLADLARRDRSGRSS